MIRSLLICITLLSASGVAYADAALKRANDLQAAGDHTSAIREYEALIATRGHSPNLLYNLGMAQNAAGKIGPALVSFERARMLAPRDPQIRQGLQTVRDRAHTPVASAAWRDRLTRSVSAREWAFAGLFGCALVCAGLLLSARSPAARRRVQALLAAGLVLGGVAVAGVLATKQSFDHALIVEEGTVARQAPYEGAAALFSISLGEAVSIERRHGTYAFVQTRAGDEGWVPAARVTPVSPSAVHQAS